jgi:hypothetical protein
VNRQGPWILGIALFAVSCAGDGVLDAPAAPPSSNAPTLTSLQASIFTPRCAVPGCHAPPAPEQGMDLSAGHPYVNTVGAGGGVDATELSGFKRIAPGNSADSYVVMKISADPRIAGEPMPADGTTLTNDEIDSIRAWIDAGAKDD